MEAVARSVAEGEVPNTLLLARPNAPYVSLGFHQAFDEELDPTFLQQRPLPVLRRVEGGGTTYLDPDQWFYQLVYREEGGGAGGPTDLERFLRAPARAARALGLSATLRPPSDLVVRGRKFSGNAGGDWEGAHLIVGAFLGRADLGSMADLLRLPHPEIRPLLRREIERWITSWEAETGRVPEERAVRDALVAAFVEEGLFRVRTGPPSPNEEKRFRTETVARHSDPHWQRIPPVPKRPGSPLRRIRIAGPHGLLVLPSSSGKELWIAIVERDLVRRAYRLVPGEREGLRRMPTASMEGEELALRVRALPPLG